MRSRVHKGLSLTELGFGASQLGNLYRETTDEESAAAIDSAWEQGVRYFDTAPHYGLGLSERRLGAALATRPRDEYVLSTKVGRLLVPSPETSGQLDGEGFVVPAEVKRQWDFSRDGVLRSIEASLERLNTDRLDVVYLHDPDAHWAAASTSAMDALIELRDQGAIGAVGVGMNQSAMLTQFVEQCDVDLVMVANRFTLLEQGALTDLMPLAIERNVGVVAAAVYNSGLLSQPRPSLNARYDYGAAPESAIRRANAIADICESHGVALPEAAVQFPLRHPAVVSIVVGSRTSAQVASNVQRYAAPIPDELWTDLTELGLVPSLTQTGISA
ncbi:aldo/keto reductase [Agromyces albus]|uniref:aldo/keto reductase n=1 Tax=Agromyces albus TaxID=205332 RepID=UPI0027897EF9|nr:aldo/keto reductase [Agromyces albus]MDQ0573860.1 D-threo-aldose 1-dehydrogenase [Agromyces albus]